MKDNPAIKMLREREKIAVTEAESKCRTAVEYERRSRIARHEEAQFRAEAAACQQAIAAVAAAERRHRIYGREVVQ